MHKFSARSIANLDTCDPRLRQLADIVLRVKDHSVVEGHRGEARQNELFDAGYTKLRFPDGQHNGMPSKAMDVQTFPYPESEQDVREEQVYLLGLYRGAAAVLGIPVRVGCDWDRDGQVADNNFDDYFHIELDESAEA